MDGKILAKVFYEFLVEKEKGKYYGNPVITDASINNYILTLINRTHEHTIGVGYKMFKSLK